MADLATLLAATDARERLWAIPGVRRIGFGLKETGGQPSGQYAFRVYVDRKRPLDEVEPASRIPPEIDGIPTDVLVLHAHRAECTSALKPGLKITREVYNARAAPGSIGCFVQKAGDPHFYILTNNHVAVPRQSEPTWRDVYQPHLTRVSEVKCNKPVARVHDEGPQWAIQEHRPIPARPGEVVYLDCALIQVLDGTSFVNEVPQGALQQDIRDLTDLSALISGPPDHPHRPAATIDVFKRGATTDLTRGTIVEVCGEELVDGVRQIVWVLEALPAAGTPGGQSFDETYELQEDEPLSIPEILDRYQGQPVTAARVGTDPADRRLRFQGTCFSAGGDSGSVWYDGERRVVGLHREGFGQELKVVGHDDKLFIPNGRGGACHIRPVLEALSLAPATAIVMGAHPTAGAQVEVPGDRLGPSLAQLAVLERDLAGAAAGERLLHAARAHEHELRELVHHRRRATLTWHRHKGPAFLAATIEELRQGRAEIPRELGGHRLVDLLRAMRVTLADEGTPALREAIDRDAELVIDLAESCATLEAVVERLRDEVADAA